MYMFCAGIIPHHASPDVTKTLTKLTYYKHTHTHARTLNFINTKKLLRQVLKLFTAYITFTNFIVWLKIQCCVTNFNIFLQLQTMLHNQYIIPLECLSVIKNNLTKLSCYTETHYHYTFYILFGSRSNSTRNKQHSLWELCSSV